MPPYSLGAPVRRPLLPFHDELDHEASPHARVKPVAAAVSPETHAANGRFANAILGTGNYEDAARSALADLRAGDAGSAASLQDLLDQLHERDPEVARAVAGSIHRLSGEQPVPVPSARSGVPRRPSPDSRRALGHLLFPGQVPAEEDNLIAEIAADATPFLGNLRSASQAARDIEELIKAAGQGEVLASVGHAAMAVVDGLGAVPVLGNLLAPAKPALRAAVRAAPGLRRAHASWTLAQAARHFDRPFGLSAENLYGNHWSKLRADQRAKLKQLQKDITGSAGEGYQDELLTSGGFRHQGDGRVAWNNPSGRARKYDAETAERFKSIYFNLFAVPDKSGGRSLFELKTAGGELSALQKRADAEISQREHVQYLRLYLDEIPFEFLASQTNAILKQRNAPFSDGEIKQLVKSMRAARTPEGKPLTAYDWLGTVSRIAADTVRPDDE